MKFILGLFREPDAFRKDPKGYLINQLGHVGLGAGLAWLGVPALVICLFFLAWELLQWQLYRAEASDCFEDMAFVMSGVVAFYAPILLPVLVFFLLAGVLFRYEGRR